MIASVSELEVWKRSILQPENPPATSPGKSHAQADTPAAATWRVIYRARWASCLAALLVLVAGVVVWHRAISGLGAPVAFQFVGDALVALDRNGRACWRVQYPQQQFPPAVAAERVARAGWVGRLNGKTVVLFVPPFEHSQPLICYDEHGGVLWRHEVTRRVRTTTEEFTPTYGLAEFQVTTLGRGRPDVILLSMSQHPFYPGQVTLLSADGAVLREYWHSGHLDKVRAADLDGDGRPEFYLAGINNARRAATLVVLDEDHFSGAGDESERPDHALQGFPPGNERARVIFPRSCLNTRFAPWNAVGDFHVSNDGILVETVELVDTFTAGIMHHLSPDLGRHRASIADSYYIAYQRLEAAHQLGPCVLNEELLQTVQVIRKDGSQPEIGGGR